MDTIKEELTESESNISSQNICSDSSLRKSEFLSLQNKNQQLKQYVDLLLKQNESLEQEIAEALERESKHRTNINKLERERNQLKTEKRQNDAKEEDSFYSNSKENLERINELNSSLALKNQDLAKKSLEINRLRADIEEKEGVIVEMERAVGEERRKLEEVEHLLKMERENGLGFEEAKAQIKQKYKTKLIAAEEISGELRESVKSLKIALERKDKVKRKTIDILTKRQFDFSVVEKLVDRVNGLNEKVNTLQRKLIQANYENINSIIKKEKERKTRFHLFDFNYQKFSKLVLKSRSKAKTKVLKNEIRESNHLAVLNNLNSRIIEKDREIIDLQQKLNKFYFKNKPKKQEIKLERDNKEINSDKEKGEGKKNDNSINGFKEEFSIELLIEIENISREVEKIKYEKEEMIRNLNNHITNEKELKEDNAKLFSLVVKLDSKFKTILKQNTDLKTENSILLNKIKYFKVLHEKIKKFRNDTEVAFKRKFLDFGKLGEEVERIENRVYDKLGRKLIGVVKRIRDEKESNESIKIENKRLLSKNELITKNSSSFVKHSNNRIEQLRLTVYDKLSSFNLKDNKKLEKLIDNFFNTLLTNLNSLIKKDDFESQLKAKEQKIKKIKNKHNKELGDLKDNILDNLKLINSFISTKSYVGKSHLKNIEEIKNLLYKKTKSKKEVCSFVNNNDIAYENLSLEYNRLSNEYNELTKKFFAFKEKIGKEETGFKRELKNIKKINSKSISGIKKDYQTLSDKYTSLSDTYVDLQKEFKNKEKENETIKEKLTKTTKELNIKRESIIHLKRKIEKINDNSKHKEKEDSANKIEIINVKLKSLKSANSILREELNRLKERLKDSEKDNEHKREKLEQLKTEKDCLNVRLVTIKEESKLKSFNNSNILQNNNNDITKNLKTQIKKLNSDIQRKEELLKNLKNKQEEDRFLNKQLENALSEKSKEAKNLKTKLFLEKNRLSKLEKELKVSKELLEVTITELNQQLESKEQNKDKLNTDFSENFGNEVDYEETCKILDISPDDISLFFKSDNKQESLRSEKEDELIGLIKDLNTENEETIKDLLIQKIRSI